MSFTSIDKKTIESGANYLMPYHTKISENAKGIFATSSLLLSFITFLKRFLYPRQIDRAIKKMLDDVAKKVFPVSDAEHSHRITLFRYYKWHYRTILHHRKIWHECLVPYERAGHLTLDSKACFLVSQNDPKRLCQGVAGKAFCDGITISISNLPDLKATKTPRKNDIKVYAQKTSVPEAYVQNIVKSQDKVRRCYWGAPIEVDGAKWGVVLVDSDSETLEFEKELENYTKILASCLSKLLSTKD